jgi:starch phosphorylase
VDIRKTQLIQRGAEKTVYKVQVEPNLPPELSFLLTLTYNLWYVWDREALDLIRRIDRDRWDEVGHNAVAFLGTLSPERLKALAGDESFLANLARVKEHFEKYLSGTSWFSRNHDDFKDLRIAYFSAEFGLNECVRIYSGGLGMLAGDHLKSASDLGLPLVGVGLLYREGYFQQYLNVDGWQQETYPDNDFVSMPVSQVKDGKGKPLTISVTLPGREVFAEVWRLNVGRNPLYLLNANIEKNHPDDREITAQLYGGDLHMRIKQEILLGIGGVRALCALGIPPQVVHMNEGHAAFLALERIRILMEEEGLKFDEAREAASPSHVFTTHTPVPAGNDEFPPDMIWSYLGEYAVKHLGLDRETFLGLGRKNPFNPQEPFGVTVLALRLSNHANGVSELHGEVSRGMWQEIWPEVPEEEIPIVHITNGVHHASWISWDMSTLLDRYLGPRWLESPDDKAVWERVAQIPYSEIWRTHERRRERLVAFSRLTQHRQLERRGASGAECEKAWEILDPHALTIGFARRFATYKRATLLFRDIGRLEALLNHPERPVQFIFAGKAHPRDTAGKELIKTIVSVARRPEFRRRIVFLENYDMNTARYLVQGVDIWLNTPRRPLEASGTSGMKATFNGVLNLSVLDGWWCEGYEPGNGWTIGGSETYDSHEQQDEVESKALYRLFEDEVVPLFYDRGIDLLPKKWIDMMRKAFVTLCPVFNTHRMVKAYAEDFYFPAYRLWREFEPDGFRLGRELAAWEESLYDHWKDIHVGRVKTNAGEAVKMGDAIVVTVPVILGGLLPEDVSVELYFGPLDVEGHLRNAEVMELAPTGERFEEAHLFQGEVIWKKAGQHGFAVRVVPNMHRMKKRFEPGLITWG